jgi:hypothetical protein
MRPPTIPIKTDKGWNLFSDPLCAIIVFFFGQTLRVWDFAVISVICLFFFSVWSNDQPDQTANIVVFVIRIVFFGYFDHYLLVICLDRLFSPPPGTAIFGDRLEMEIRCKSNLEVDTYGMLCNE